MTEKKRPKSKWTETRRRFTEAEQEGEGAVFLIATILGEQRRKRRDGGDRRSKEAYPRPPQFQSPTHSTPLLESHPKGAASGDPWRHA